MGRDVRPSLPCPAYILTACAQEIQLVCVHLVASGSHERSTRKSVLLPCGREQEVMLQASWRCCISECGTPMCCIMCCTSQMALHLISAGKLMCYHRS